jgi:hypothetical protein
MQLLPDLRPIRSRRQWNTKDKQHPEQDDRQVSLQTVFKRLPVPLPAGEPANMTGVRSDFLRLSRRLGHVVAQFVEALRRKVAGSIPDGIIPIFHSHTPPSRTMTMGLTQPLIEMSTRNTSWGVKAAGADNLTTFMCRLS